VVINVLTRYDLDPHLRGMMRSHIGKRPRVDR